MTILDSRWLLPGALMLGMAAALMHLGWEHGHGGIQRHHLLNDASLPAISNAWGLLVLPMLGALAGWGVARRTRARPGCALPALAGFLGALGAGAALSVAFVTHGEAAATQVMLAIVVASVVLPVYRAEYLFGFVLGMTFVFGAVLPALIACVPMLIATVSRQVVWRAVSWGLRRARAGSAAGPATPMEASAHADR
ncbi:hypothetical protein KQ945_15605 [Bacillus subtilis subsp. subtilis]|nr:hypothetical protein [Bacillus subtilis subsp. subtilis]